MYFVFLCSMVHVYILWSDCRCVTYPTRPASLALVGIVRKVVGLSSAVLALSVNHCAVRFSALDSIENQTDYAELVPSAPSPDSSFILPCKTAEPVTKELISAFVSLPLSLLFCSRTERQDESRSINVSSFQHISTFGGFIGD